MPIKNNESHDSKIDNWQYDENFIAVVNSIYKLRRHNSDGSFTFYGKYEDSVITFGLFNPLDLTAITGFDFIGKIPEDTNVKFRLSTDEGSTYKIFDTSTSLWVLDNLDQFAPIDDLNSGISSLDLSPNKNILLQVKLYTNVEQNLTPMLSNVMISFEIQTYNTYEDIHRSFKRYLEDNLSVPFRQSKKLFAPSIQEEIEAVVNIKSVVSVYDITNDPNKLINLFSAYNDSTKIVTFLSTINDNCVVEINYSGLPKILINQDPDFEKITFPEIYIDFTDCKEKKQLRNDNDYNEAPYGSEMAVMRHAPKYKDFNVYITSYSPRAISSLNMSYEIDDLLSDNVKIKSLGSTFPISIIGYDCYNNNDIIEDNLKIKRSSCVASIIDFARTKEEVKIIKTIKVQQGLTRNFFRN